MSLSLLTVNIEEHKHFDRILPYLAAEKFDVVCMQEVLEKNVAQLAEIADAQPFYAPLAKLDGAEVWGLLILVRNEFTVASHLTKYYKGAAEPIPDFSFATPNAVNRAVMNVQVVKDQQTYSLSTTHFTWAGGGGVDPQQLHDFPLMKKIVAEIGETILCGDFNSPRGKSPVFDNLAKIYTDNIPDGVTTTIDQELHRAKGLQLVVDGVFSSASYFLKNVQVVPGLSDHCGVKAEVFLI